MHSYGGFDEVSGPLRRLVELILLEALDLGATEILMRRSSDRVEISYRIEGQLQERDSQPLRLWHPLLAQIHLMAQGPRPGAPDGIILETLPNDLPDELRQRLEAGQKVPAEFALEFKQNTVRLSVKPGS